MASSSTASVHKSFKYDVFLSFRGEDTRKNFIDHLYYALRQKGINTYKDDEAIRKGNLINNELIRSIQDSRYYIIVFSKNYTSSAWCLNELVKIMECHQTTEHTAFPVFYDVEPTEVRNQTGVVGEAFANHKNDEAAGKWKKALEEAADLAGWELKNTANGYEAVFIQKIVKEISEKLHSINFSIDNKLVGMETRVNHVVSYLETNIEDVCMIGIWGIGGGGKTTLARAVFNQISFQFERKSFVENVREVSNNPLFGMKSLQKQVLSNVLNDQNINVDGIYDGIDMMRKMMHGHKALLVLDDVDHVKQLEALAGDPGWFKPGSRIIVTTRDKQVLEAHRVLILDVKLLSCEEQKCLFGRYAFEGEIPIQEYVELSEQVINYAQGLPLTIKVLGSLLCGKKDKSEWRDTIERLKKIPLDETLKKLELSYESLEEEHKEIFLDVACILKGRPKDKVIQALESCGFCARHGLRVLEKKSLITIDEYKGNECVGMHDHIEEMGKNIVYRSHPKPQKRSRLWIDKEIKQILANDSGTKATKCIRFYTVKVNPDIIMKGFIRMKELRFLAVRLYDSNCLSSTVSPCFPDALQYLSWYRYPFRYLPKTFEANSLVTLVLANSNIVQLWEGGDQKVLNKLKFLDLNYSKLTTLDLGLIPNLEVLSLKGCCNLVQLHKLDGCLNLISVKISQSKLKTVDLRSAVNLELLKLKDCNALVEFDLPDGCLNLISVNISQSELKTVDLRSAVNLGRIKLKDCNALVELHLPDGCLNLISVKISQSNLKTVDLLSAVNLELLKLKDCNALVELHLPNECPNLISVRFSQSKLKTVDLRSALNLELLKLKNCNVLVELHLPDGCLNLISFKISQSKLKTIDLRSAVNIALLDLTDNNDLVELHLPDGCQKLTQLNCTRSKLMTLDIGSTPNLEVLDLRNCYNLEELHMADKCQKLITLNIIHSKLRTFNLGLTPNLKNLDLKECNNLVQIHAPTGCLENISYLDLSGCLRFTSFLYDKRIGVSSNIYKSLEDGPSAELHLIATSLIRCPLHPDNTMPKFEFLCFYKDNPSLTRNLEMLSSVGLCACTNLETFSQSICGLQRLKKLTIDGYPAVPKDFDQLESLEHLQFLSLMTEHLPDTICMLKNLRNLELESCWLLQKLPEDLGRLECLEKLTLSSKKIKQLPNSICMLKHLKFLKVSDCVALEKLPEDLGLLECLETLNLSYTKIKYLPNTFCMLKGLRYLNLNHCPFLDKLPEDLGGLKCLELLSLRQCTFLEDLPNSICEMKCLMELDIEDTCIDYLPRSIHLLKGLRIYGSGGLLQACGFTSFPYGDSCYAEV